MTWRYFLLDPFYPYFLTPIVFLMALPVVKPDGACFSTHIATRTSTQPRGLTPLMARVKTDRTSCSIWLNYEAKDIVHPCGTKGLTPMSPKKESGVKGQNIAIKL